MSNFVICSSQGAIGANDKVHGSPNYARGLQEERVPWVSEGGGSEGTACLQLHYTSLLFSSVF